MEQILIITGCYFFLNELFYKWGVWELIERKASGFKFKFFYDLANCDFCRSFYLIVVITALCVNDAKDMFLCVVVSGLTQILKK